MTKTALFVCVGRKERTLPLRLLFGVVQVEGSFTYCLTVIRVRLKWRKLGLRSLRTPDRTDSHGLA